VSFLKCFFFKIGSSQYLMVTLAGNYVNR